MVLQLPHMPPWAAVSALVVKADAWLPRPRTARPDLNSLDTTPIQTEYNFADELGRERSPVGRFALGVVLLRKRSNVG